MNKQAGRKMECFNAMHLSKDAPMDMCKNEKMCYMQSVRKEKC